MIKYLIIILVGFALTLGTAFKGQDISHGSELAVKFCSKIEVSSCAQDADVPLGDQKGFPFKYISNYFNTDQDVSSLADLSSGFSVVNFVKSLGFWGVAAAAGYFVFTKLRNLAGNMVIVAAAVGAALLYLGLITI